MKDKGKPHLTRKANELLEEHAKKIRNKIHNIAERRVIDEERDEINENDILQAQKNVPIRISSRRRKWGIRTLIFLSFTFLIAQIGAFYQLFSYISSKELPLILHVWLVVPAILVLFLLVIFTWIFEEDWL